MSSPAHNSACPNCDALFDLGELAANHAAHCPRCNHRASTHRAHAFELSLANSIAALVLLFIAASFPFMSFAVSGRTVSMTLLDSAVALFFHEQRLLGFVVFVLVFAAPLLLLLVQSALATLLLLKRPSPWLGTLARALHVLRTWNMVEVFLVSVFVSAAKLSSMAQLELGVAFFAFAGFVGCTLASTQFLDTVQMWRRIEALRFR